MEVTAQAEISQGQGRWEPRHSPWPGRGGPCPASHTCHRCAKWLPSLPPPGCPPGWACSELIAPGGRWGREKSFPMLVSPDSRQVLRGLRRFSPSRSPQKAHTSCRVHITGGETEAQAEWPRRSGLRVSARRLLGLPVLLRAALQCSCAVIWAGARPSQTAPRWAAVCSVCPHACEPSAHAHPRRTCCGACTGPPQPGSRARGLFLDGEGWDPLHVGAGQRVADVAAVRGPAVWPPATQ